VLLDRFGSRAFTRVFVWIGMALALLLMDSGNDNLV
jgi:hypothetical protein